MFGYSDGELIGAPVEILVPENLRETHERHREKYMASPQVRPMMSGLHFSARRKDGSLFAAEISLGPVNAGRGTFFVSAVRDITDRNRIMGKLETNYLIQSTVASILRASLDAGSIEEIVGRILDELLSVSWINLRPIGSIFLTDEDNTDRLRLAAASGFSREQQASCGDADSVEPVCAQAATTGEIVFTTGHFCVPVLSGGRLLGAVNLYVDAGHEPTSEEKNFLLAIADMLAGVIGRKRAEATLRGREAQLLAAQWIQKQFLPKNPPELDGFDIAGSIYPADFAAGDLYDFIPLNDGSTGLVIGDVAGHGIGSALVMASTHAYLHSFAAVYTDVGEVLALTNAALVEETDPDMFVTTFFGRLDPERRLFTYASAGHPAGYILGRSGRVKIRLERTSMPLAIVPSYENNPTEPVILDPGDILLLLTDGVLEARSSSGSLFGVEQTLEIVHANRHRTSREIVDSLYSAVIAFTGTDHPSDDVTIMILKVEE